MNRDGGPPVKDALLGSSGGVFTYAMAGSLPGAIPGAALTLSTEASAPQICCATLTSFAAVIVLVKALT